jgi:hypothetical protein
MYTYQLLGSFTFVKTSAESKLGGRLWQGFKHRKEMTRLYVLCVCVCVLI